jgi:hypothetical protein
MTDWLAQIGGVSSALAGLDMAMPGDGDIPLLGLAYWAYDLSTSVLVSQVPGKHSLLFVVLKPGAFVLSFNIFMSQYAVFPEVKFLFPLFES